MITRSEQCFDGYDAVLWSLHIEGRQVAELAVHTSGLILNIEVDRDHRRRGHARRLYEHAWRHATILHAPAWSQTPDGTAFAEAVGGPTMDDHCVRQILGVRDPHPRSDDASAPARQET
ncbi:hypothetical protein ACFT2C_06015 [Promicromonospora sp. NPDC057138]|uniref:hypothetical protein n=1 Tax=Promicromonospora sp. NPDC057138 TaxID=3346031 RepID=UPI0036346931